MNKHLVLIGLVLGTSAAIAAKDPRAEPPPGDPSYQLSSDCQHILRHIMTATGVQQEHRSALREAAGAKSGDDVLMIHDLRELMPAITTSKQRLDVLRTAWYALRPGGRIVVTTSSTQSSFFDPIESEAKFLGMKTRRIAVPELKRLGLVLGPKFDYPADEN